MSALQQGLAQNIHEDNVAKIRQQYRSLGAYDNAAKIQMVKDTSLNPFLFDDPFDGLTNSLSRWAQEAPSYAGKDDKTKAEVAEHYYDNVLAPMYQHMKAPPLEKDVWMSQAWGQALKYDPAQSYHSKVVHGLVESLPGMLAPAARTGQFVANVLGMPVAAFADSVKHGDFSGITGFVNLYMNMHNRVPKEGFFKAVESEGEKAPILGEWGKFDKDVANYNSFWHDVTPDRSFTEKATSFVAENALLLPLFGGLTAANEAGIGLVKAAAEGVPYVANLTEALGATKSGQFASRFLTYGSEGLIWGLATRKDNDKKNAWQDALTFAAMGSVFSLLGKKGAKLEPPKGIDNGSGTRGGDGSGRVEATPTPRPPGPSSLSRSHILNGEYIYDNDTPGNLHEFLPVGEDRSRMLEAHQDALVVSKGERYASIDEIYQDHREEMAHNIAVGGMSVQHAIFEEALDHIAAWGQHIDTPETKTFMERTLQRDSARFKPVYSSMQMMLRHLKENNLSTDVIKHPLEHEKEYLGLINFVKQQSYRAAAEMNVHVPEVVSASAESLAKKAPGTAPEQAKGFVAKAAETKEVTGSVNAANNAVKTPPRRRMDSKFEYDAKGNPTAYSMNISYDWKVAKENLAKAHGGSAKDASSNKFWKDFVESTTGKTDDTETANKAFIEDLRQYFNPLKEAGLQFEKGSKSGGEVSGGDYTNFLGFMYHYRDELPEPVKDKLEEILMNSPKMYQLLGAKPSVAKLEHFGQAIQNHIDMFMRSSWYQKKGQRNVFRSTQPAGKTKTKWQMDLIKDTWNSDIAQATTLYPGRSKAVLEARESYKTAINALYHEEVIGAKSGDEKRVAEIMSKIRKRAGGK